MLFTNKLVTNRRRAALLLLVGASLALAAAKKPILFSGKIQSIDLRHRTVAVTHGEIPGFMPAMTMDYPVDEPSTLARLSPGDEIEATVYVGDPTLHEVHVIRHYFGGKH